MQLATKKIYDTKDTTRVKPFFQPRLTVGPVNDVYEQEADAMADRVMRMEDSDHVQPKQTISSVQRKCAECEEEERAQRKGNGQTTGEAPSIVSDVVNSGGGKNLDNNTRSFMENRFGYDFSHVKIHDDTVAAKSAQSINALAYTSGNNIVFNQGQYSPETNNGKKLLAHELTHVVQQRPDNKTVQRSCFDGNCETCAGGWKDFWITFFFRRRATRRTMEYLRNQINGAKRIFEQCCLRLKADFNWTLLGGGGTFNWMRTPPGDRWRYTADATNLGTQTTFSGSRGIPILVVDEVPSSGGGVTVDTRFDPAYTGRTYAALAVNQPNENPGCNHLAHELWHVGSGIVGHDAAHGTLAACTGNGVSERYCTGLRAMV